MRVKFCICDKTICETEIKRIPQKGEYIWLNQDCVDKFVCGHYKVKGIGINFDVLADGSCDESYVVILDSRV